MKKTAIIYSFNTRKSKKIAEKIIEKYADDKVEAVNAEELTIEVFKKYDKFILSAPTWFDGELPNYWDEFIPDLEEMDLKNKTFAVFGLGDQKGYPENFCDAIGILVEILEECGAKVVGSTSVEGYSHESSRAQKGDKFVGLALDQENQARLSNERVDNWVEQLKIEMK
ncbi:MAG: flavodoxin [Prolixibacteraceae bacterium]|jgi:flavodoxin I|nr:flavodoxin [Prolixibacteraceae bacterium]MBT6763886.1 flavodoxin [Prolixibacteraceae bacterium]MBT7000700.1 flavodoxin [Prolixibacteraceae bacterium]MBT7393616.1 flavodoxin [Prolixibacteraceae bacterium]